MNARLLEKPAKLLLLVATCMVAALTGCSDGDVELDDANFPPGPGHSPGAPCRATDHPDGPCDQDLSGADFVDMVCVNDLCLVDCAAGGDYLCRDLVASSLACSALAGDVCVPACGDPGNTCSEGSSCFSLENVCLPTGSFPTSPCRDDAADACDQDLGGLTNADMKCVEGVCAVDCAAEGSAVCLQVDASLTCSGAAGDACVPGCATGCPEDFSCFDSEGACLPTGIFPGSPCIEGPIGSEPTCGSVGDTPLSCVDGICIIPCDAAADGDAVCAAVDASLGCSGVAGVCVPACVDGACPSGFSCFETEDRCLPTGAFPGSPCAAPADTCFEIGNSADPSSPFPQICVEGFCTVSCDAAAGGAELCAAVSSALGCASLVGGCAPACVTGECPDGSSCFDSDNVCLPTGAFPGSPCRDDDGSGAPTCDQDLLGISIVDMQCTQGLCLVGCAEGGDALCGVVDPSLGCSNAAGVCLPRCGADGSCAAGLTCFASEGICLPTGSFPGSPCLDEGGDALPVCGSLPGDIPMACVEPAPGVGELCVVDCSVGGTAACQAVDSSLSCFDDGGPGPALCLPNGAFPESLCRDSGFNRCDRDLQGQSDIDMACVSGTCQVSCAGGGQALCGLYAQGLGLPGGALTCHDYGSGAFCARAGCATSGVVCPEHYVCDATSNACLPYQPVHIIHTNDLHSHFDGVGPFSNPPEGGYPQLASLIKAAQQHADERGAVRLTLDGGDFMMGSLFHLLQGVVEFDFFRYLDYDAVALGNHELDWGPAPLASFLAKDTAASPVLNPVISGVLNCTVGQSGCPAMSPVPVLASNMVFDDLGSSDDALAALYDADGSADVGTRPLKRFVVVESAGRRVGIFGLLGQDAVQVTPSAAPLTFDDIVDSATEMVALLRGAPHDVDIVVALSHSGSAPPPLADEDEVVAEAVDGLDVIVSGHTHQLVAPKRISDTWIVQALEYGRVLGDLQLAYNTIPWGPAAGKIDGDVVSFEPTLVDPAGASDPDPVLLAARTSYVQQIDGFLAPAGLTYSTPVGAITTPLLKQTRAESTLGNLVADANRVFVSAVLALGADPNPVDVAFEANGILRDDLNVDPDNIPTPVLVADAFAVEPLGASPTDQTNVGYPITTTYLNAGEVRAVLEAGVTLSELRGDAFWMNASGVRWVYDPARPAFARVTGIWLDADGSANVCNPGANLLKADLSPKDPAKLYRAAANVYVGGFAEVLGSLTGGALNVAPKTLSGAPSSIFDSIVATPEGELRQWVTLVQHLVVLAQTNNGLIPEPSLGRILTAAQHAQLCAQ